MGTDKDAFAREMLVSKGMDASQITEPALPVGETFHKLIELTDETPEALPRLLHGTHNIGMTWCFFACVGLVAAALIRAYGKSVRKFAELEKHGV